MSAAGDKPTSRPYLAHTSPISRLYLAGERAGVRAAGDKRALLMTNHQQALLRAVIHALLTLTLALTLALALALALALTLTLTLTRSTTRSGVTARSFGSTPLL